MTETSKKKFKVVKKEELSFDIDMYSYDIEMLKTRFKKRYGVKLKETTGTGYTFEGPTHVIKLNKV